MNIRLACLEGDPVAGVILVVNQDCGALCNDCISPVAHNFDVLLTVKTCIHQLNERHCKIRKLDWFLVFGRAKADSEPCGRGMIGQHTKALVQRCRCFDPRMGMKSFKDHLYRRTILIDQLVREVLNRSINGGAGKDAVNCLG